MLTNLNRILVHTTLVLAVFEERYGGGYMAFLAPILEHAAWIENQLTGADIPAVEMQTFLGTAGDRFPVGHGREPVEAIERLDALLANVGSSADDIRQWRDTVQASYDSMFDAEKKYRGEQYFIGIARDAGELCLVN